MQSEAYDTTDKLPKMTTVVYYSWPECCRFCENRIQNDNNTSSCNHGFKPDHIWYDGFDQKTSCMYFKKEAQF